MNIELEKSKQNISISKYYLNMLKHIHFGYNLKNSYGLMRPRHLRLNTFFLKTNLAVQISTLWEFSKVTPSMYAKSSNCGNFEEDFPTVVADRMVKFIISFMAAKLILGKFVLRFYSRANIQAKKNVKKSPLALRKYIFRLEQVKIEKNIKIFYILAAIVIITL